MRRPGSISIAAARPPRGAKLTDGGWLHLPAAASQTYIPTQVAALAPLVKDGLLRGGLIRTPAGFALHRPARNDHLLVLATQAAAEISINGEWRELPSGFACWVCLGQTLTVRYEGTGTLALTRFAFQTTSRIAQKADAAEWLSVPHAALLVNSLQGIFALDRDPQDRADVRLFADYVRILQRHLEVAVSPNSDRLDPSSTLVWETLVADPGRPWRVEELANISGLHPRTLARRLRERFGCSLQALLVEVRMRAAETLLRGSHLSLDAIAMQVGYADAFSFSKAFTRSHAGVSPKAWRESPLP
jgi:AraC-like DNA-binding protein